MKVMLDILDNKAQYMLYTIGRDLREALEFARRDKGEEP